MPYPTGTAVGFTPAPYDSVSARGGDDSKTGEQEDDRNAHEQGTDHHQDLSEQAEAAAMAQPTQP